MAMVRFGGSFAPPLTSDKIKSYSKMAKDKPNKEKYPEAVDAMEKLCNCAEVFQKTGDSKLPGNPHPSGKGVIVPLEEEEKKRIFDAVPWAKELKMYGQVFESISATEDKALRDAAFHLLWYAKELEQDREPITTDKL